MDFVKPQQNIMKSLLPLLSSVIVWSTSSLYAADGAWLTNFETAKKNAVSEKKELFLEFTGSDWCPPCKRLHDTILTNDVFLEYAKSHFVLVELDYPRKKKLDAELVKQNSALQQQMKVSAYPTVLLCDESGKPYASNPFRNQLPVDYIADLEKLRKVRTARDAAFTAADQAQGLAKAELLAKGLQTMESKIVDANYSDVLQQIAQLDPENTIAYTKERLAEATKQKEKAATSQMLTTFMRDTLGPLLKAEDIAGAEKAIDTFQEKNPSIPQETFQRMKFSSVLSHYMDTMNEEAAIAHVNKFVEANPTSPTSQNPERLIAMVKQIIQKKKDSVPKATKE
jgi:thioredoxin-related protein